LGVGFVLNGDGIVGVDLDKCVTDTTPAPAAMDLMNRIGCTYIEYSPSGTGLRGFGYGESLDGKRKKGVFAGLNVELYATARYLTVTGRSIVQGPLKPLPGFAAVAADLETPTPT
jgi:primase-polymerase (primpol)-like protein